MGFLTGLPSYRKSLSASPHGAQNTDTLDLKAQTVRNQKTRVEWGFICSRGWCAVDASLALSLASRFFLGGGARLQFCLRTPCTHTPPWAWHCRPALPQAARGLFIPLLTSPGQQALCPAFRRLPLPLALLPRIPRIRQQSSFGSFSSRHSMPMLAPLRQPPEASAQHCVG